jgi:hypothetical protein
MDWKLLRQKLRKVGNSYGVLIPREFVTDTEGKESKHFEIKVRDRSHEEETCDCDCPSESCPDEHYRTEFKGCIDCNYLLGRLDQKDMQIMDLDKKCFRQSSEIMNLRQVLEKANKEIDSLRIDKLFHLGKVDDTCKLRDENDALKEKLNDLSNALAEIGEIVEETK